MHYGSVLGDSEVTLRAFEDAYHMSSTDTVFKHDVSDILGKVLEMLAMRVLNIKAKYKTHNTKPKICNCMQKFGASLQKEKMSHQDLYVYNTK